MNLYLNELCEFLCDKQIRIEVKVIGVLFWGRFVAIPFLILVGGTCFLFYILLFNHTSKI